MLKLLVVGGGGREHTIAQKLAESPIVSKVYCAPGNPGMKKDGISLVPIKETNHAALIEFAKAEELDWVFIGPEVPLLNGIVDDFEAAGIAAYGPKKAAAKIEGSKEFAKQIMSKYEIPTADYQVFSEYESAKAYLQEKGVPIVIKADGLAAGKGVVVAADEESATQALQEMLQEQKFGSSSNRVVIEEFLAGEEFSLLAFVRGTEVYPMVVAQDHKRAFAGDRGPNTGGMGAYAPVPQIPQSLIDEAIETVLKPTAAGLVAENRSFQGVLYAGLIATTQGIKVIEFNARFGDPEAQVVLQRLESDLATVINDLVIGNIPQIKWKEKGYNLGVVVAAEGYPAEYKKNFPLSDFMLSPTTHIYYAGVKEEENTLYASGGRVFLVETFGETLKEAQEKAYNELGRLNLVNLFYREDIGFKGIN